MASSDDLKMAKQKTLSARDRYLRAKYGISEAQWLAVLKAQGGTCAICEGNNGGKTLSLDHDHKTRRVRGLLCYRCNRYLVGRHRDGRLLKLAGKYLDRKVVPSL